MILEEADDFEIVWGARNLGRYMVNSQEPFKIDLVEEFNKAEKDPYKMIDNLLKSGIIIEYKPNYLVEIGMFDDNIEITRFDDTDTTKK